MLTIQLRKTYNLLIVAFVLLYLATCLSACNESQVTSNAYKTLSIAADSYDGAMKAAADLGNRGLLEEATKEKIISIGRKYKTAHEVGSSALEAYAQTTRAEDEEKLSTALTEVMRLVWELQEILHPLIGPKM